jgi:exonuclease SbcC
MIYPKIYSLSTAGMVKHYNNDYLFHHKRTDFIGPNGVGKSILADLLQLMFIYDKELIKFGTEDVKETRYIHTLPYLATCAYCFLNIAIQKDTFITIGIQIQDKERKRIIPFVVAKSAELHHDLSLLTFNKNELLLSKDFLVDGIIPEIQELATFLSDYRNLKLTYFKNRETVQEYYNFLSSKEILPINLSRENNLKAFAKVIQSFSKAKTLKLSGKEASKTLKEFLFEETEEEIKADFEKEKNALEKVLKDYQRLNDDIQVLKDKQKRLTSLRQQDENCRSLLKEYRIVELSNSYLNLNTQKALEEKGRQQSKQQTEDFRILQNTISRIPQIETVMRSQSGKAEKNYEQIHRYKQLTEQIEELQTEVTELKMIILPKIDDSWKIVTRKVDVAIRTVAQMKADVNYAESYLENYETLAEIETARKKQSEELFRLKKHLDSEEKQKRKLLQLLSNNEEDSLLAWYVNNFPTLDAGKMQAILHYATMPIYEIESPANGMRFVDPDKIEEFKTTDIHGGVWLKSGALSEFIAYNPDAGLLMNHSELNRHVQQLINNLKTELAAIESKLKALDAIEDGISYDTDLFEYKFDIHISEAAKLGQLKEAIAYILHRDEKIVKLQAEKSKMESELITLQHQFNLRYKEPEIVEHDLKKIRDQWNRRINNLSNYSGEKTGELKSIQKEMELTKKELGTITRNLTTILDEFNQLNTDYYRQFHENIVQFNPEYRELQPLKRLEDEAYENYKTAYIEITTAFEETKGGKNADVNFEIQKHSYSFHVLERALLSNKIRTTDDIATALQEANNNRTQIADNIRDNLIKIFSRTSEGYNRYKTQVQTINTFFINRKISGKYNFSIAFDPNPNVRIEDIEKMAYDVRQAATRGELQFDQSITEFLQEFFRRMAKLKDIVPIAQLLDPKTYFHLSTKLENESGEDISGSTGESYSAIALLGVARLSTQKTKQKGLRFIILEELGSMDNTNFNIFPSIAEEFQYQIVTMAPHTFNIGLSDEWYAHYLIKGKENDKINYYPASSFFRTKDVKEHLSAYLNKVTA